MTPHTRTGDAHRPYVALTVTSWRECTELVTIEPALTGKSVTSSDWGRG
jgi:hypothetical protein